MLLQFFEKIKHVLFRYSYSACYPRKRNLYKKGNCEDIYGKMIAERKEYYWEHMGKMDEPEYIEQALQRISAYEKNNIFPGNKLILRHETFKYPINSRNIEKVIFQYLK